ncbi:hypothetical protein [Streptomyces qinglanensis]|uniref:hypothetical protein n=1 Tax=Streptomyces qinglanensis TaxID=943816 RepID=UPI0013A6981A|nr:hypothetical protein [Streptomyces qinglanensis]
MIRGDGREYVVDVGDHATALEADPVPLRVVLARDPQQAEEEVALGSPAVLQVVAGRSALAGRVEGTTVARPVRGFRVRDAQEAARFLDLLDQGGSGDLQVGAGDGREAGVAALAGTSLGVDD